MFGAVAVFFAAVIASVILEVLFHPDLAGGIISLEKTAAGVGLGLIATALASESRSIGMLVGCWIGMGFLLSLAF